MEVHIEGLEDLVREVVRQEIAASQVAEEEGGWLDSKKAAEYIGVRRQTIHNLVSDGKLPRYGEKGYAIRLRRSDLDRYVEGRGRR